MALWVLWRPCIFPPYYRNPQRSRATSKFLVIPSRDKVFAFTMPSPRRIHFLRLKPPRSPVPSCSAHLDRCLILLLVLSIDVVIASFSMSVGIRSGIPRKYAVNLV